MNIYQRTMRRLSTTGWFRWLLSKILGPLDMWLKNTPFAPSKFGVDFPLCYLTVPGRRTGEPRTVPLLFVESTGGYAVTGTNFGKRSHPAWVYNLAASDTAVLEIDGSSQDVTVRELLDDEKSALWHDFDQVWPGYKNYREVAPRDIRVFLLTPLEPGSPTGQ